jgi:hypothetical protein
MRPARTRSDRRPRRGMRGPGRVARGRALAPHTGGPRVLPERLPPSVRIRRTPSSSSTSTHGGCRPHARAARRSRANRAALHSPEVRARWMRDVRLPPRGHAAVQAVVELPRCGVHVLAATGHTQAGAPMTSSPATTCPPGRRAIRAIAQIESGNYASSRSARCAATSEVGAARWPPTGRHLARALCSTNTAPCCAPSFWVCGGC